VGAAFGVVAKAATGEPLSAVTAIEGHRIWAAGYDAAPNPLIALETRVLLEKLTALPCSRFLDIACGTGRWMQWAMQHGHRVFGIDACPEMLFEAARKPGLAGHLTLADACHLPLADGAADLTLCSFALSYVSSADAAIAEMARVARKGAHVIVTDMHPAALVAGWTRSFRSTGQLYGMDHHLHPIAAWESAAASVGLTLEWRLDACFAEPEREIFVQAGKDSSFAELSRIPAVLAMCWSKSCD
jgi:ubiquinone/menaquinone biosynthesis C-methylase UbiE